MRGILRKRIANFKLPHLFMIVGASDPPIQPPKGNPIPTSPQADLLTLKHPKNVGVDLLVEQDVNTLAGTLVELMA